MKMTERNDKLIDLYYIMSDINKIESRLMQVKQECGNMIQCLIQEELENEKSRNRKGSGKRP